MEIISRMIHVTKDDMENKRGYGFHNPFITAIERSFPEAKYIWVDEDIHLNFINEDGGAECFRIPTPLHIKAWLQTFNMRPGKCDPISFGITVPVWKPSESSLRE